MGNDERFCNDGITIEFIPLHGTGAIYSLLQSKMLIVSQQHTFKLPGVFFLSIKSKQVPVAQFPQPVTQKRFC